MANQLAAGQGAQSGSGFTLGKPPSRPANLTESVPGRVLREAERQRLRHPAASTLISALGQNVRVLMRFVDGIVVDGLELGEIGLGCV